MEPNQPFVRVYFTKHASELHIQGGLFHLHTANGKIEIAAVSINKGTHHILYQVWPEFIKKCSTLLQLGNVYKWDHKEGLLAWLDSVIYHSFAEGQEQGFPRGWFVKNIPAGNAYELTGIPIGFERFFYQEGKSFWILLKNGTKVWPIRMIKNNFRDNWNNFLKDHEVKTNYKVVFGCYRKWIFDVTVLNTNLERVMQSWNTEDNGSVRLQILDHNSENISKT